MHSPGTDTSPAHILVVDDTPNSLHLLTSMLSERGYSTLPTTEGARALTSAQANPPDLILLDIMMPGLDGYAVCKALKADERTREVPVIFISAMSEPFDKVRAFAAGGVDYITKPFDSEEVLARIATHLALRRLQQQLEQQNAQLQREIAERRQAEAALHESQALLQALLEHAPVAIGVQDLQGRYIIVNRALLQGSGMTDPQQILGRTLEDIAAPGTVRAAREQLQQIIVSGKPVAHEYAIPSPAGTRVLLSVGFPIRDASGAIYAVGGIGTDITSQKQHMAALYESRALLRSIIDNAPALISARDLQGRFTLVNRPTWEQISFDNPQQVLGKTVADIYAPDVAAQIETADRQVLDGVEQVQWEHRTDWHGQPSTWLSTSFPIHSASGALNAIGTIAQDITERRRIEQALKSTNVMLLQRVDELSTINSIGQLLSTVTDLPAALDAVCETTTRLFNIVGALIGTLDSNDTRLTVRAQFVHGAGHPDLAGQVVQLSEQTAAPRTVVEKRSVQHTRILDTLHDRLRLLTGCDLQLVTLRARQRLIGVLAILSSQPDRRLTPAEVSLAGTIAGQVAVAIENARLYEHAMSIAVDTERQRLRRELHDSVTQLLYSMTLLTDAWAARAAEGTLDNIAGRIRQLGAVSRQALRDLRLLIYQLRPAALEEVGLINALRRRLESVEQRLGIATHITAEGDLSNLSQFLDEQVFAIAQEALNNALRHAGASQVDVHICLDADQVTLTIHDDGHGFDLTEQSAGMGLITMRERAAAAGGTLTINSTLWQGTTVEMIALLESTAAREASPAFED